MGAKNDYFGASASYQHAITAKLGRILVNLTKCLASKGFCYTSKMDFPAFFCDFSCPIFGWFSQLLETRKWRFSFGV